jgi:DNA helicase-2/ATP-dependent DNA helicase PcrA
MPISLADTPEAVAEERRLLYVGITRAQELLEVSYSRSKAGGRGNRKPTRYLANRFPKATTPTGGQAGRNLAKVQKAELSPADIGLFEQLRTWRSSIAANVSKPAFTVLPDSSLIALALARPTDLTALSRIPGIGPMKLEAYGADLLNLVTKYQPD